MGFGEARRPWVTRAWPPPAASAVFDAMGRITQMVSQDGTSTYGYDSKSQLTSATHSYQSNETYTFDNNGNRTMSGYQTGTDNRLTNDGTYSYTYDAEGNRLTRTKTATGEVTEYTWDYHNRLDQGHREELAGHGHAGGRIHLRCVRSPDRPEDRHVGAVRHGQRRDRAVRARRHPQWSRVRRWRQRRAGLRGSGRQRRPGHRHVEAIPVRRGGRSALCPGRSVQDARRRELATCGHWSIIWARSATWPSRTARSRLTTSTTPSATSQSGDTSKTRYLFTSREFDTATKLQYNRARYYDAAVGRWISEDPLGFAAGDANVGRYVGNQVTGVTDPSGLQPPDSVMDRRLGIGPFHSQEPGKPSPRVPIVRGLPGEVGRLWPGIKKSCPGGCTQNQLSQLLRLIQNAIDDTFVFPFWPGQCQCWIDEFDLRLAGPLPVPRLHPAVFEAGQGWEPSPYLGGGHAFYEIRLIDGHDHTN